MIKIFNANDKDFSTAGNIIIEPIKCNEIKKKSLNDWYIDVEVSIKYKDHISKDKLCVVKTKSKLNPQAFRVGEEIEYSTRKIKFKAKHVMFDAKDYALLDVRPTNQNGLNALNYINERTDNVSPFTMHSNVENVNTAYFIRKNLLEAWAIIEERWGGVFDADNWNISFLTSVGNDNGETVAYGKNMQGFDIFEDWSSVCTKLYPVGYDGLMLPEEYISSDVEYEKPYTRIIDFQTDLEGEEQTKENLLQELRTKAEEYLEKNKTPKVSYTIISNINNELEIGDTIKVLHPFVNIFTEVLEYENDLIAKKLLSLTFGNYSRDVKTKFNNIKNTIEQINQVVSKQEVVINNQTNLINSLNKNGYVYIDENEILILDTIPKEKAKNVWRFGLGGIGFSSNGYEGPFEVAMTMDGQINANFITTGTLAVSRIEGLSNFISETERQISNIEIEQGKITSRVESIVDTKGEAEGKFIHIKDSAEEPLVDISLHGETNQKTRSGKNKLKNTATTTTINGITFTVNNDGTVIANGTSTAIAQIQIGKPIVGTYKYTGCPNGGNYSNAYRMRIRNSAPPYTEYGTDVGNGVGLTFESILDSDVITLTIDSGVTVNNLLFKPMISVDGGEYEPYGASPSPEFPSEIENIEGNIEVKVEGKNIFNNNFNDYTMPKDYRIYPIKLEKGKVYRFNTTLIGTAVTGIVVGIVKSGNMYSEFSSLLFQTINSSGGINNLAFTVDDTWTSPKLVVYATTKTIFEQIFENYNVQLVEGTEILDYEPYKSQTAYFPLTEGQKLMEGSYLADDGVHNVRKQVVLDGSDDENWAANGTSQGYGIVIGNIGGNTTGTIASDVLCNKLTCVPQNKVFNGSAINGVASLGGTVNKIYVRFDSSITTVTLLRSKLAENPITVEYELVEEEIVPYTEEQQEAWNKIKELTTYKNITNITSEAYAKVVYMRDNGLDVYETKQNADKRYTETTEKFAEQKITVDGVITQVSDTNKRLTNEYLTAEQVNAELDTTNENIEILSRKQAKTELTSEQFRIEIDKIVNEGVSKVKTSMGYTFDDEGFKLDREGAETGTIIDEAAVEVIDKTGSKDQNLLYAGYVKEGNEHYPDYVGQTIVASANMIVQNYLVVPNSRFEKYENPVLRGQGTGVFGV